MIIFNIILFLYGIEIMAAVVFAAPSIHYTFDSNLTNHGSGGSTYDAIIVNGSLDYDTTNKQIGNASMEIKAGASQDGGSHNNSLEIGNMDKSASDSFTFSFWFQTPTGSNHKRLFHSLGGFGQMVIWLNTNGTTMTRYHTGMMDVHNVPKYDGNGFHHFVYINNAGTHTCYVDNTLHSFGGSTTMSGNFTRFRMGGALNQSDPTIGLGNIDDFRWYDYAADATFVDYIYRLGSNTNVAGLSGATISNLQNAGATISNLQNAGFTVADLLAGGVVPDWSFDTDANHFVQSYVKGFIDISGSLLLRETANLTVTGNIETKGNITIKNLTMAADLSLNHNMLVVGDISMNGNVTVGDVSMNGNVVDCSFTDASIPESAFNGTIPAPDYTQPTIQYNKGFDTTADVSMNANVQISKLKVDGNVAFSDGTTMDTYDDNKESNGTTFKASTFTSLTINNTLTAGTFSTSSDYRIKTDISQLDETVTIDNLRPVKYLQTLLNKPQYGLIAHELQEYYPDLVVGEKDGEEWQRVNYTGLVALLINEIKQLKRELTELENGM